MKNSLRIFKIHFTHKTIELPLGYVPLKTTIKECKSIWINFPDGCLFERKHQFLQTQFHMKFSDSYWLLVFDEQLKFVSAKPYIRTKQSISFFISDPYIVLIPFDKNFPIDSIESLEIIDNHDNKIDIELTADPRLMFWVKKLQNDPFWFNTRFKKLKGNYPVFTVPEGLIDEVELDEFLKFELGRIPLFKSSQLGIRPSLKRMYRENADFGVIAVLRTFYLSGIVAGLSIYLLSGNNRQKIAHFENIDE